MIPRYHVLRLIESRPAAGSPLHLQQFLQDTRITCTPVRTYSRVVPVVEVQKHVYSAVD